MTNIGNLWRALSAIAGHLSAPAVTLGVSVVLLAVAVFVAVKARRGVRHASRNAKLTVGTAFVQAGVTWVVVTGTYAFWRTVFGVPAWEATAFAVFLEAATWVAAGMIYAHAKDGQSGFGPAAPFFWLFSVLGGLLAVIAGHTHGEMTGRAVVVVFGSCLWYLQLLRVTVRSAVPGRWRWTPHRLLVAVGAIEPGDADVRDENREWQIRRLARAMRWANASRPWSWVGRRTLIRRGETTQEDVIVEARRRYAVAHLLTSSVRPDSPVMKQIISEAEVEATRSAVEAEQARLEAVRLAVRLAERLEAERAERAVLQQRCDAAERARDAAEALLHRARTDDGARREQEVRSERPGAERARQSKQSAAPNAPKLTDDEAVRVMCRAHRDPGYEWSKREVHRLTGAGFGRIDRLIAAIAEHRRSTPDCDCAERDDSDDAEERVS